MSMSRGAAEYERLTYTVPEVAQMLGISRGSAFAAVKRGEIPAVRIGKRLLVPRAALLAMLDGGSRP